MRLNSAFSDSKLRSFLTKVLTFIGNLFSPPVCVICQCYSKQEICPDCMKLVIRAERDQNRSSGLFTYGDLYYYARYSGVIKELIRKYKFRGQMWLGKCIGNIMHDYYEDVFPNYDYIVYVPVTKESMRKRGFDQCYEIVSQISKKSGVPILDVLEGNSVKGRQSRLRRGLRKENVTGRFVIKHDLTEAKLNAVKGSKVLIVDDILTTGSTLRECAALLIDICGCRKVDAMVFATGRTDI